MHPIAPARDLAPEQIMRTMANEQEARHGTSPLPNLRKPRRRE
jgi:hypothetical protein